MTAKTLNRIGMVIFTLTMVGYVAKGLGYF